MPGRGHQGKGGLRATGSPLGESGEQNLRGKRTADRMPEPLVISLIDWTSGDVARRLKITARGARLRKSPATAGKTEAANHGRKSKAENAGSMRPRPKAGGEGSQKLETVRVKARA